MSDLTMRAVKLDAQTSVVDLVVRELVRSSLNATTMESPSRRLYEQEKISLLTKLRDTLVGELGEDVVGMVERGEGPVIQ